MKQSDQTEKRSSKRIGDMVFTFANLVTDILDNDILEGTAYQINPGHFYYTLLHKLRNVLDASSFLIANLDGKPHYTDSAYLLLRTCLLDVSNLYFVVDKSEDKAAEQARIERIMSDHVRAIYNSAKGDEVERTAVREAYPDCFEGDKFKREIMPVNIIITRNEIDSPSLKKEMEFIIHYYNIFSKIEHNGTLSFDMLHAPYYPLGKIRATSRIYAAIGTIMKGVIILIRHVWIHQDDKRVERMQALMGDILEIEWPELSQP